MFECEGKDACVESTLLVTAALYLALASFSFSPSFSSAHLPNTDISVSAYMFSDMNRVLKCLLKEYYFAFSVFSDL